MSERNNLKLNIFCFKVDRPCLVDDDRWSVDAVSGLQDFQQVDLSLVRAVVEESFCRLNNHNNIAVPAFDIVTESWPEHNFYVQFPNDDRRNVPELVWAGQYSWESHDQD